jgi:hypothetical protein
MAVTKPDMQQKLNMSPDQIQQIAMIVDQSSQARRELRSQPNPMFQAFRTPDGNFDRNAMRAKMQDPAFKAQMDAMRQQQNDQQDSLQQQTIKAIGSVLTKSQKAKFNKMLGTIIDPAKFDRNYDPAAAKAAAAAAKTSKSSTSSKSTKGKSSTSSKKKTTAKSKRTP